MKNVLLKSLITCSIFVVVLTYQATCQLPKVYSIDAKILAASKQKILHGDKQAQAACFNLLKVADKSLSVSPFTVMNKVQTPPSGDKHDYMSLAPYFWPNPNTPNGLPYVNKDGEITPEVKDFKDKDDMVKMCSTVEILSLAYYFSGDEKYAERCALLIRTWFIFPDTKMNPNVKYGQAVKGLNEGRKEGVLETRSFSKVVDAIGLLQGSKSWTANDQQAMQNWIGEFLAWIQTDKLGVAEMNATNNHGTWFDAQRLSYALFLGKHDLANEICKNAITRLDKQMDEFGTFPRELARTKSLGYSFFNVNAFFQIAVLAEKTDVDLWKEVTPSGKSLRKAIEALAPYFSKEKEWTGKQIEPYNLASEIPLFYLASIKYNHPEYLKVIANLKTPALASDWKQLILGFMD